MSEKNSNTFLLLLTMIMIAVTFWSICNYNWKRSIVQHNFAEFNQITGQWQWKTNVVITNFVTITNVSK